MSVRNDSVSFWAIVGRTKESQNISSVERSLHHAGWLQSKTVSIQTKMWTIPSKLGQQPLQQNLIFIRNQPNITGVRWYFYITCEYVDILDLILKKSMPKTRTYRFIEREYLLIRRIRNANLLKEVENSQTKFSKVSSKTLFRNRPHEIK